MGLWSAKSRHHTYLLTIFTSTNENLYATAEGRLGGSEWCDRNVKFSQIIINWKCFPFITIFKWMRKSRRGRWRLWWRQRWTGRQSVSHIQLNGNYNRGKKRRCRLKIHSVFSLWQFIHNTLHANDCVHRLRSLKSGMEGILFDPTTSEWHPLFFFFKVRFQLN